MAKDAWQIGKARFEVLEKEINFEDKPVGSDEVQQGKITTFKVSTSDLSTVIFGVVTWPTGVSEAVPVDVRQDGESKYQRLQNAGRMTLLNFGDKWVGELNVMKHNADRGRANLSGATYDDLCHLADSDLLSFLQTFGYVEVGTREALHGETNKNRNRLAFKTDSGNKEMVAAAYVVTRVLAILKDFGM